MSEQEAWLMVNKISGLIEERDALKQRVDFLVAEAHGWQPRLEAAEEEIKRLNHDAAGWEKSHREAESELDRIRSAAEWLIANRGHRGEQQAWKLLADALAKEPT